ncbi:Hypothetical predicted protein [Cloeon dipterum]|nr:Hypothetical predicted protein [Cloeon dipterum]
MHYPEKSEPDWTCLLINKLKRHFELAMCETITTIKALKGGNLIMAYNTLWNELVNNCIMLNALFTSYNSKISKNTTFKINDFFTKASFPEKKLTVGELAYSIWKEKVYTFVLGEIFGSLIFGFEGANQELHEAISTMRDNFKQLGEINGAKNPEGFFEESVLEQYSTHCQKQAAQMLKNLGVNKYVRDVFQLRCKTSFFSESLLQKMNEIFREQCVGKYTDVLLKASVEIVEREPAEVLGKLFQLLESFDAELAELASIWQKKVEHDCLENLYADEISDPVRFVKNLIEFNQKYRNFIKVHFNDSRIFVSALDKARDEIFNSNGRNAALMFVRCCNFYLCKSPDASESKSKEMLDQAFDLLFKKSTKKDFINACLEKYACFLLTRLMDDLSLSMELEMHMANRFHNECPDDTYQAAASRMIYMLNDMADSPDLTKMLSEYVQSALTESECTYSLNVLSKAAWPESENKCTPKTKLSNLLDLNMEEISELYKSSKEDYKHRDLQWCPHFSQCFVKTSFINKEYSLKMNVVQAEILILFFEKGTLNFADVKNITEIPSKELSMYITSLVNAKLLISDTKIIGPESKLTLNRDFSSQENSIVIEDPCIFGDEEIDHKVDQKSELRLRLISSRMERYFKKEKDSAMTLEYVIERINNELKKMKPEPEEVRDCVDRLIKKGVLKLTTELSKMTM